MPVLAKIGTEVATAVIASIATSAVIKLGETLWKIKRKPHVTIIKPAH